MPTYEYECRSCGHRFDQFQNMSDDPLQVCPSCGETALKRLVGGGIGIIFKGSGFYVNDSKSESSAAKKSGSKSENETSASSTESSSGSSESATSSTEKSSDSGGKATEKAS